MRLHLDLGHFLGTGSESLRAVIGRRLDADLLAGHLERLVVAGLEAVLGQLVHLIDELVVLVVAVESLYGASAIASARAETDAASTARLVLVETLERL